MFTPTLTTLPPQKKLSGVVYVVMAAGQIPSPALKALLPLKLLAAAQQQARFKAEPESILTLPQLATGGVSTVVLVGLGEAGKLSLASYRLAGQLVGKHAKGLQLKQATVMLDPALCPGLKADQALAVLEGVAQTQYSFDTFKTKTGSQTVALDTLQLATTGVVAAKVKPELGTLVALMTTQAEVRDWVNLPANHMRTTDLAAQAKALTKLGVKVEILGPKELAKLGMNLFLSVAAGSATPAQMLVLRWTGPGASKAPLKALVGKGVMYDTGGYSLKPSDSMVGMKADMAGAAAVLGAIKALALTRAKVNVVGICGCAENMVNEHATRPGDIFKAYNGMTVEVNNTDAEGRLVLADCLAYVIDKFKPAEVINIATFTGACMVALGAPYAGLFSNNKKLADNLQQVGEVVGERLWPMPMGPEYHKLNQTDTADLSNTPKGRYAGHIGAACFLENFVGKTPWAHLDIAGVGMCDKVPGFSSHLNGASGFGMRLFWQYLTQKPAR